MDTLRYVLAVGLLMVMPPVYLYWFSIHPFIAFWRRVGRRRTLIIHCSCMVLVAILMYRLRQPLLIIDYGTNLKLALFALLPMVMSVYLRVRISRQFRGSTMQGLPELADEKHEGALGTRGIYSRIRHPRYLQILCSMLAFSLVCNYLGVYVLMLLGIPWALSVVWLEEKELSDRFGEEYEQYRKRVPRFFPR